MCVWFSSSLLCILMAMLQINSPVDRRLSALRLGPHPFGWGWGCQLVHKKARSAAKSEGRARVRRESGPGIGVCAGQDGGVVQPLDYREVTGVEEGVDLFGIVSKRRCFLAESSPLIV